jgi:hypothetical protein
MMVPKKSLIFAGAALALVGATASAQSQSGKFFARYTKPLRTATLDLATGTVTRGPVFEDRVATTVSTFWNNDISGFVGADTGNGFCQWVDAATKSHPNDAEYMRRFRFIYCSSMLDLFSGGPGGSTRIAFYEGYTTGGGASTTVAIFSLTGLPSNTAHSSIFSSPAGGTSCFAIQIIVAGNMIPFSDGPISYSWRFMDQDTSPFGLAATIPALGCISSCSGPGPDGRGMDDLLDQYCPPGTLLTTFSFGSSSAGTYFTSLGMDIREIADCTATVTSYNSTSPVNVDTLTSNPAIINSTWTAEVTHAAGTAAFSTMYVRGSKIAGNGAPGGAGGTRGRFLVTGAFYDDVASGPDTISPILNTQRNFSAFIPLSFDLACIDWFGQALTGGAGQIKWSNGIDGDTGTE